METKDYLDQNSEKTKLAVAQEDHQKFLTLTRDSYDIMINEYRLAKKRIRMCARNIDSRYKKGEFETPKEKRFFKKLKKDISRMFTHSQNMLENLLKMDQARDKIIKELIEEGKI